MYSCRGDIDFRVPGSSRANRACSWAMSAWGDLWTFCVYKDKKKDTASKARCIPLDVPNAPRPLRTEEWPDGLSGLSKVEQARVDSANSLYHTLADSVKSTIKKGVIHVVENPRSSLFWQTSAWLRVRNLFQYTAFQSCASR